MKEPLSIRFWRRIREFSEKMIRHHWTDFHTNDRKCPHCGTWASLSPGGRLACAGVANQHPMLDWHQCDQCGEWSLWWEDMLSWPVDPDTQKFLDNFEIRRDTKLNTEPPKDIKWNPK